MFKIRECSQTIWVMSAEKTRQSVIVSTSNFPLVPDWLAKHFIISFVRHLSAARKTRRIFGWLIWAVEAIIAIFYVFLSLDWDWWPTPCRGSSSNRVNFLSCSENRNSRVFRQVARIFRFSYFSGSPLIFLLIEKPNTHSNFTIVANSISPNRKSGKSVLQFNSL